jgi:multiple sugar transport system permease protein
MIETPLPGVARTWTTRTRGKSQNPNRDIVPASILLAPGLILFIVFVAIPIVGGLLLSFFSWNLVGFPQWVGLQNFARLFHDPLVGTSLLNTAEFVLLGVIPTVILGLVIAVFINVRMRGIAALRTLYLIPAVVSFAASAVLWRWIYSPTSGVLNYALSWIGIDGKAWLTNTTTALPALVVIGIWLTLPISILFYMAALQRIPESVIEAAMIDGAGAFQRLLRIIWPQVAPMTLLVALVTFITFANGSFDLVNLLTQGGPVNSTTTLVYYIYTTAFQNLDLGYAAALGVVQLAFIIACLLLAQLGRKAVETRW